MKIVIMAGGQGTRLWPVSRVKQPKQVLPFFDNVTLLEKTISRLQQVVTLKDIYITCGANMVEQIKKQAPGIPMKNYSIEPARMDTAPAMGLAAAKLYRKNPNDVMVVVGSDAYVGDEKLYGKTLAALAKTVAQHPHFSGTVGIKPTYPETGYGYIERGKKLGSVAGMAFHKVARFIEKPTLAKAKRLVKNENYLWNPGLFAWNVSNLLDLFDKYLPTTGSILRQIANAKTDAEADRLTKKLYAQTDKISIDYAILEKTPHIFVIPASFVWSDIGHWRALKEVLAIDGTDNVVSGQTLHLNTSSCLVYSSHPKRLIATVGLRNIAIVDAGDALLVCDLANAQSVKDIVKEIEKKKHLHRHL